MGIREIWNRLTISERREILVRFGFPDNSDINNIVNLDKEEFEIWMLEYAYSEFPEDFDEIEKSLKDDEL